VSQHTDLKTTLIINERAGGGSMLDCFRRLEHRLVDMFGDFELRFTEARGHATELVREALGAGTQRIIAGGGDGTVNEVVNGFFDQNGKALAPEAVLGLLPGGTGGDLRKTLGLHDEESAMNALAGGNTLACDVGLLTYRDDQGQTRRRHFINIASFGFSGSVDRFVGNFSALPGQWAYLAATARAMMDFTNPTVTLTVDDHFEAQAPITTVAVANGKYFGAGMMVAPEAQVDDGLFDVTVLGAMTRLELLGLARTIYDGKHLDEGKVLALQGRVVEATSDEEVPLDVDGEALGWLPARFEVTPKALQVCVGEVLK
jgi:diacylglycerol kinase (ATP)